MQEWSFLIESNMANSIEVNGYGREEGTSIWRIMMNPYNIEMKDISNVFFDTIIRVSDMSFFNAQELTLAHRLEEQAINRVLHHEQAVGFNENAAGPCFCVTPMKVD